MKKGLSLVLAAAMLIAIASAASAGDYFTVKREYTTPYGKVKVREYHAPAYYWGSPYYYAPAPAYTYYTPVTYYEPCYPATYWTAPSYYSGYPYWGPCEIEIDD